MAKLSYYLKKRRGKEVHPLYLRITHQRKSRLISTDVSLSEKDWNQEKELVRKSHTRAKKLNNYLFLMKLQAQGKFLDLLQDDPFISIDDIQLCLTRNTCTDSTEEKEGTDEQVSQDFFSFAEELRVGFRRIGKYQRYKNYGTVLAKMESFLNQDTLPFNQITVSFLRKFEIYLMDNCGNNANTVNNNMKKIRKVFNDAIREGLVSRDQYPFIYYKIPSSPVSKTKLTKEEIKKFADVQTNSGSRLWDSQNMFLFAYYCRGMRFRDVILLKWKNIKGDRLVYISSKTEKKLSMKLVPQALEILNCYRDTGHTGKDQFIFPFLDSRKDYTDREYLERQISAKNALVNQRLKDLQELAKIEENLSFHIARHSFAQLAHENDLRLTEIQELLGHSDIKTTMIYLQSLGDDHLDSTADRLFT